MAKRKKKGKSNSVSVDFTGVEAGGGSKVKPGEYIAEVLEVTQEESGEGNPYLKWVLKVTEGKYKGSKLYHNTSLQPQALWNLRGFLEAMEVEVPDSEMDLDLDEYVGMKVGVVVERETYNGKQQARCVGFFNAEDGADGESDDSDEDDSDEDEDEDDSDSDDSDSDDEDEEEEDDSDSDDEDEDEDEEDEKPSRKKKKAAGKKRRK